MAAMFDKFGPFGLKLLKFTCTAGTICVIALAEIQPTRQRSSRRQFCSWWR